MAVLIDRYSESNEDFAVYSYTDTQEQVGQSFAVESAIILKNCHVWLRKFGSPTGNCYVVIYAHSGTYGTSSIPTGSVLATSDTLDVSTLPNSFPLIEHTFSFSGAGAIKLSANTKYCLAVVYGAGNTDNCIGVGADSSSPTHAGNLFLTNDGVTWSTYSTYDLVFEVYGDPSIPIGTYGGFYAGGNYFAGSPKQPSDFIKVGLFDGVSLSDIKISQTQKGLFEGIILSDSISKVLGAFRSFVEGVNVSDSIVKAFHRVKNFVESVVVTDTMGKVGAYVRSLVESINVADSITKSISYVRSFIDSIRATDFIQTTRQFIANLVDSIVAVDTVAKRAIKDMKESINVSDTLSRLLTASRSFVDSIVASDVVVKLTRLKTFVDNMSITDFVSKVIGKVVSSAITVADTFSRTIDYIRTFVDTFNITDIIDILQGTILNFVDHIVARDNIVKTVGKYLTDTVEMLDDLVRGFFVSLSDTIKAIDDFHIAQAFKMVLTEMIQVSDLISKHANILLTSVVKILDNRFTRRLNGQLIEWGKQVRKVLEWAKVIKKQDQYIKVIKKDSQEWNKEEKNFGSYQSLKKASDDWTKLKKE